MLREESLKIKKAAECGFFCGMYWTRTSDPRPVKAML